MSSPASCTLKLYPPGIQRANLVHIVAITMTIYLSKRAPHSNQVLTLTPSLPPSEAPTPHRHSRRNVFATSRPDSPPPFLPKRRPMPRTPPSARLVVSPSLMPNRPGLGVFGTGRPNSVVAWDTYIPFHGIFVDRDSPSHYWASYYICD